MRDQGKVKVCSPSGGTTLYFMNQSRHLVKEALVPPLSSENDHCNYTKYLLSLYYVSGIVPSLLNELSLLVLTAIL